MKARSRGLSGIVLFASGIALVLAADPVAEAATPAHRVILATEGAPTSVTARPTAEGARVMWHAPVAPTGRTLTSYVVRATGGTSVTVGASTTAANLTGLATGHWYAFTVTGDL